MARASYSPETRNTVLAAIAAGATIVDAAERFGVPEGTIKAWVSRRDPGGPVATVATVATVRHDELGELISGYLTELLTTLSAQARVYRDPEWLKGQKAAELAALHTTLADSAIRILSAIQPVESGGDDALPD